MRRLAAAVLALLTLSAAETPAPVPVALAYTGKDVATRETFGRIKAAVAAEPAFRIVSMTQSPAMSVRIYDVRRGADGLKFRYATYIPSLHSRFEWDAACMKGHEQDCADAVVQTLEDLADRMTPADRPG